MFILVFPHIIWYNGGINVISKRKYKIVHYSEWPEEQKEVSREASRRWNARNVGKRKDYYTYYETIRTNENRLWKSSKTRAVNVGIQHTITVEDVVIYDNCPICQRKMQVAKGSGGGTSDSPTLDRVKPELGYVPGNVAVICKHCNSTKGNGSAELHRMIAEYIDHFN